MSPKPRNQKSCAYCKRVFMVPGSCQDYQFKRGSLYYCGYSHWLIAEPEKKSKPKHK